MSSAATKSDTKSDYALVDLDSNHLTATAFNMAFMVWSRETLAAPYRRGVALVTQLAQKTGGTVGVCQVVEADAVPPDSDTRRAILELMQLSQVAHSSVVHDGTGFKAATVRAVVNLQTLLSKSAIPHLVFSSAQEAAAWHVKMQGQLTCPLEAARIERVIRELRALHRERYP